MIIYPDCKGNGERILDKATELLAVLTICRLHQGVMAYMLKVGESTVQRTFVAWIVFLETIFNCIDLKPKAGFFTKKKKMPDIFVKTGHGLTDMIIDCNEFKFQHV